MRYRLPTVALVLAIWLLVGIQPVKQGHYHYSVEQVEKRMAGITPVEYIPKMGKFLIFMQKRGGGFWRAV